MQRATRPSPATPAAPPLQRPPHVHPALLPTLLLAGAGLASWVGWHNWNGTSQAFAAAAQNHPSCATPLAAAFVPYGIAIGAAILVLLYRPANELVLRLREKVAQPRPLIMGAITIGISVLAAQYFLYSAEKQGRGFAPVFHDEYMYLLQARLASEGRLWLPQHALPEFFDTFYVLTKPVYAPVYFPGTALIHAIGLRLGLFPAATSALVCGLIAGLTYRIITELIDGSAGILGALVLVTATNFRGLSTLSISHSCVLLLGLGMTCAWLRWRRTQGFGAAAVLGLFSGWALITRPLDAICLLGPVALAMALQVRGRPARRWVATAAVAAVAAAPFLAMQLALDRRTTGHWLQTPVVVWLREAFPVLTFAHRAELDRPSASPLPQVRNLYDTFIRPLAAEFRRRGYLRILFDQRLPALAPLALPYAASWALIPLGWLGLRKCQRWAVWAAAPLLLLGSMMYPVFLTHYLTAGAPALILNALLGLRVLDDWFPGRQRACGNSLTVAILVLSLAAVPELNPLVRDRFMSPPELRLIDDALQHLDHNPAVVLFRYHSWNNPHEEPVFNLDTADPDDAAVIRAHDLGDAADRRLAAYYSQRQPDRYFYLYDRGEYGSRALHPLGTARDGADGKWHYPPSPP